MVKLILETSDDMIDAATAVAWWRRVGDKKIVRWLDYCQDDTSPPLLPTLSVKILLLSSITSYHDTFYP